MNANLLNALIVCVFGPAIIFAGSLLNAQESCPPLRYVNRVFPSTQVNRNIVWGGVRATVDNNKTFMAFDMYEPKGDTASLRPFIILLHGGGFFWPISRRSPELVELAYDLSKRGYVVISAEYRIHKTLLFTPGDLILKTAIMAAVDVSDLLCHLKGTVEQGNPYRIDTTAFFIGGCSAGAMLAMNFGTFYKSLTDFAPKLQPLMLEVGEIDQIDINEKISHTYCGVQPKGVISISGNLFDTTLIKPFGTEFLIIHGKKDPEIFYEEGYLQSNADLIYGYGPARFLPVFDKVGVKYEADIYPDAGHVPVLKLGFALDMLVDFLETGTFFDTMIMDSTKNHIASFCSRIIGINTSGCTATSINNHQVKSGLMKMMPNPSNGVFKVQMPDELLGQPLRVQSFDISGKLMDDFTSIGAPSMNINMESAPTGVYLLMVRPLDAQQPVSYIDKFMIE